MTRVSEVRDELVGELHKKGCRGSVVTLAGDLIGCPVLNVPQARDLLGVSYQAANSAVATMVMLGILRQVSGGRYGRLFRCQRVFDVIANA